MSKEIRGCKSAEYGVYGGAIVKLAYLEMEFYVGK